MDTVERWLIASPNCGRDKDGTYRCVCGRCRRLPSNEGQDGRNEEVTNVDTVEMIAKLLQQGMETNPEATRAVLMGIQMGFALAELELNKKAG